MLALYLKYRPQTLNDLIGQETVKKTLTESFNSGKLSHAYLFVGPRGTGKTSTARILAKMVNCENNVILASEARPESKEDAGQASMTKVVPCNKCQTCISITDGSNLDLIEIDAASNRGIDDIRSLRENIKLSPSGSKKKIYIIDEVHMLTTEAFNALLKTLEEPPSHTMFILATTEGAKIPQTILSRVQKLDFRLAKPADIISALKRVIEGEKIKIDDDSLRLLAKKADGSFRDAVKLLDQLSSGNLEITPAQVEVAFSSSDFGKLVELLKKLAVKDAKGALTDLGTLSQTGVQAKELTLSLMDILRSLVFIKNGLDAMVKEDFGSGKFEELKVLSEKFSIPDLVKSLNLMQSALEKLKTASIQSLPLELVVVEICEQRSEVRVQSIERNEGVLPPNVANSRRAEGERTRDEQSESQGESTVGAVSEQVSGAADRNNILNDNVVRSDEILKLQEKWIFILETVRPYNFSLEALLRSSKIAECIDGAVLLEVPYAFHQRILESPKNREMLESVIGEVLGKPAKVSCILGERPQRLEDIANVEIAADDEIIALAADIFQGKLID